MEIQMKRSLIAALLATTFCACANAQPHGGLELRHVSDHPSHDGGVRQGDTAVSHELDEVAIRESIADVPAHAQFDDLGVEAAPAVDRVTRDRLRHGGLRSNGAILSDARRCTRTNPSHAAARAERSPRIGFTL